MAIKYALLVYLVIGCAEICLGGDTSRCCDPAQSTNIPNPFYDFVRGFGYYKLSSVQETWNEAKKTCESEGAHLAIINSAREANILDELRRRMPNPRIGFDIYVGVKRTNGNWKTLSGQNLKDTGFDTWEVKPDNGNLDCAAYSTESHKLKPVSCTATLIFACELEV